MLQYEEFLPVAPQPRTTSKQMPYSEYFHSVQGEGFFIGKRVVFFRLPICNLRCVWCDSKRAVSGIHTQVIDFKDLANYLIEQNKVKAIIWTGGEPLVNYKKILDFEKFLGENYHPSSIPHFHFETNGTIYQEELMELGYYFTVSPKLGTSRQDSKLKKDVLRSYIQAFGKTRSQGQFKFVIQNREDLSKVYELLQEIDYPTNRELILQPEWYQFEEKMRQDQTTDYWKMYWMFIKDLTEHLMSREEWSKYDYRVLPQMHKMLWGNVEGV